MESKNKNNLLLRSSSATAIQWACSPPRNSAHSKLQSALTCSLVNQNLLTRTEICLRCAFYCNFIIFGAEASLIFPKSQISDRDLKILRPQILGQILGACRGLRFLDIMTYRNHHEGLTGRKGVAHNLNFNISESQVCRLDSTIPTPCRWTEHGV